MKTIVVSAAIALLSGCASQNSQLASQVADLSNEQRSLDTQLAQVEIEAAGLHTMTDSNSSHDTCQVWTNATSPSTGHTGVVTMHIRCNDGSHCTIQGIGGGFRSDCFENGPTIPWASNK